MNPSAIDESAHRLRDFLLRIPDFPEIPAAIEPYNHMGATLTDTILQPGLNYKHTVRPRVEDLLKRYPDATTTEAFQAVVETDGAASVLNVANVRKQQALIDVLVLLMAENLQTEGAVRMWLRQPEHRAQLQTIKGIKTKTCHYLQILCAEPDAVAVDVNLRTFFARAGIAVPDDEALAQVVKRTAELLGVAPASLDFAIWSWVASGRKDEA